MEDHPVQFGFDAGAKGAGIIFYPVDADIDFTNGGWAGRKVKCDNVRIIIVLQVLTVDFKEALIGTENIVEGLQRLLFLFKNGFDKGFQCCAVFQ